MIYSLEEYGPDEIGRHNSCLEEIDKILKKYDCRLETKIEIVGEKIYPSVVVRANKIKGEVVSHINGDGFTNKEK